MRTSEQDIWAAAQPLLSPLPSPRRLQFHTPQTQAADLQAQIDSLGVAPQRLTPDATSGRTLRSYARRGTKGWIALHRPDGEVVYIKLDQIVFVMGAKDTGAAERARSMVQLLNGHSDVRESVEGAMEIIENDGLLAKDDT